MRLLCFMAVWLGGGGVAAHAADMLQALQQSGSMHTLQYGSIAICLAIGFLSVAIRASLDDQPFSTSHLLLRALLVVLAILGAAKIQGFLWSTGQHLANTLLPGPSFEELHNVLLKKVVTLRLENGDVPGDHNIVTDPGLFVQDVFRNLGFKILLTMEYVSLTFFQFAYQWFQSVQHVVMMFLGAIAPLMFCASIIPGVNGFSNWLKLLISVALWPMIASFFLKAHVLAAAEFLGDPSQTIFGGDLSQFFLNMDALQLLFESCIYAFFLLATPFISAGVVSGSASAFAMGSSFLLAAGPFTTLTASGHAAAFGQQKGRGAAQILYNAYPLLRHPFQAPRRVMHEAKKSLSASARFRPYQKGR